MESAPETENSSRIVNWRPAFALAAGLMCGIAVCGMLEHTGVILLAAMLSVSGAALFILKKYRFFTFLLAVLIGLGSAFTALPKQFDTGNYMVSGIVIDSYQQNGKTVLLLSDASLDENRLNKRVLLTIKEGTAQIGDRVHAQSKCRMPSKQFGAYNELHSRLASRIGCIASAETITVVSEHNAPVAEALISVRLSIEERINAAFKDDSGIFSALILGERSEVGEERYSVFRTSGTAHLLAISGFHMGIIAGAIGLFIPKGKRKLRLIIVTSVMASYCAVAAYAPGFVRAAIMTFFVLAADCLERKNDTLSSLSIAAVCILLVNPYQLYSLGFQLSFSACFGLILFARSISETLTKIKLPQKLASPVAATLSAIAGTSALQMRYYNSFSPYTLLTNLLAIPAFSIIVITGPIVTAIAFISPSLAGSLAIVPRAVLFVIEKMLAFASELPLAKTEFASPSTVCCLIWLITLFVLSEYVLRPEKKRIVYASIGLILFTLVYLVGIIRV